jgi:hypothetical protein
LTGLASLLGLFLLAPPALAQQPQPQTEPEPPPATSPAPAAPGDQATPQQAAPDLPPATSTNPAPATSPQQEGQPPPAVNTPAPPSTELQSPVLPAPAGEEPCPTCGVNPAPAAPAPGALGETCPTCQPPAQASAAPVRRRPPVFETDFSIGFGDFTGSMGHATNLGITYGARLGATLAKLMTLSVGYFGSTMGAENTSWSSNSIQTNGVDMQLRIAPLALFGITPYALVGVGGLYVSAGQRGAVTGAFDNGWAGQTPLGGGLLITPVRWLGVGAEASYNFLWDQQFVPRGMEATNNTNMWNVAATLNFYL